jgi:tetratricopeptide (TPR) repeat protein
MRRDPRNADAPSLLSLAYRGLTHADFECFEPKASLNVKLLRQVALDVLHVEGDRPRACELFAVLFDAWPEARITTASALAEAHTDPVLSRAWLVQVREAARSRGFRQLDHDEQLALDDAVRVLAQDAIAEKDLPAALAHWEIFATSPASGIDTRRKLIDGYVEIGQLVRAVVHLEALLHFQLSTDERKRWTARKRELYRSITPVDLTPVLRDVESTFDFDACYRWASEAFDKHDDPAVVSHFLSLAELGGVRQLRFVNMLLGRQHFRAGDYEKSALCFEQVRARPPARFQNVDEEKIYFRACRLLGEIYVEHLNDPARAIEPLKLFKDHVDSGADTLFLLGRAYEQLGQIAQARKWYDLVLVYPSHPKAAAARDALARLARE